MQYILLIFCIVTIVECNLKVLRPPELINKLGSQINIALANFGQIPFGHRLLGYIDMAQPRDGCSPLRPSFGSQFILIERGSCTFVAKVRNAQNAGYSLAIIGNDNDEPLQSDFIMADDGQGYFVDIPSIFISSKDFRQLAEYVEKYTVNDSALEKVFLLVKFDVQKKDQIDVIFSLDVEDRDSYRVIEEFSEYYDLIKDQNVNYTLLYSIFDGTNANIDLIDEDNCICQRKYCAVDPDGQGVASGKHIIEEALRQTCLFKIFPQQYFQYMIQFNQNCTKPQAYSHCGSKLLNDLKIKVDEIKKCEDASFKNSVNDATTNNQTNSYNVILDHQMQLQNGAGLLGIPSVAVNSVVYKGQLTGKGIFGEICNSFISAPSACKNEVDNFYSFEGQGQNNLFWILLFVSILIAMFIIILYFLFKRFVQKDSVEVTQVQVNEMVSQYIKFYEGKEQKNQNSS